MPTDRRSPMASELPKTQKARAGRTPASSTPLDIRTAGIRIGAEAQERVRERIGLRLAKFGRQIERVTVRFTDVNGPKGGVDKEVSVQVQLASLPTVVAQETDSDLFRALTRAGHVAERSVRRALDKHGFSSHERRGERGAPGRRRKRELNPPPPGGQFIGKRVGASSKDMGDVLSRPDKKRRDAFVDTSMPGVSDTDRRAGGGSTARRNSMKRAPKATAVLEDSATKPSRKSSRRSANRTKSATPKTTSTINAVRSPSARAQRRGGKRG